MLPTICCCELIKRPSAIRNSIVADEPITFCQKRCYDRRARVTGEISRAKRRPPIRKVTAPPPDVFSLYHTEFDSHTGKNDTDLLASDLLVC